MPLHPTTTSALTRYLRRRDRPGPVGATEALLLSSVGTRLGISDVQTCFRALRARAGILPRSAACRPRLHDIRHSFAVNTLLDAYRTNGDPPRASRRYRPTWGMSIPARPIGICTPRPNCSSSPADAWNATSEPDDERARNISASVVHRPAGPRAQRQPAYDRLLPRHDPAAAHLRIPSAGGRAIKA
ncbi:MAG: hypothetical protein ACXVUE_19220 [Solirubrobacteraceae bacterium]